MTRIALLGTGLLGSGMVRRFLKNGHNVTVWNRTASKAQALAAAGATVARSPEDAVNGAEHVHFVLSDDEAVDGIIEQIAPALNRDAVLIDHTTTLPEKTTLRFERLRGRGVRFIHAPVFMSPQMAEEGTGFMLVSAPQAEYDALRSELERMTGQLWYLGDRPDLAAAHKLFGNCMLFAINGGLSDIMAMARANDIDPVSALDVFTRFNPANIIAARGPRMARGETTPASFEVSMARKDVRLMIEAAKDQPLVNLPGLAKRMDDVIADGHGHDDLAAIGVARR